MIEQLQEQIKVVSKARQAIVQLADKKKVSLAKWEQENLTLLNELALVVKETYEAEATLRELTLQAYAETGNKTPAVGVGIREVTKLNYDGKVAFDWAKSHKMALQLDKKAFEKIAKADTPDFVTISQEPQATIATNLCENNTTREEK